MQAVSGEKCTSLFATLFHLHKRSTCQPRPSRCPFLSPYPGHYASTAASVTFTIQVPRPDIYEVFISYCPHPNRASAAVQVRRDYLDGLAEREFTTGFDMTQVWRPPDGLGKGRGKYMLPSRGRRRHCSASPPHLPSPPDRHQKAPRSPAGPSDRPLLLRGGERFHPHHCRAGCDGLLVGRPPHHPPRHSLGLGARRRAYRYALDIQTDPTPDKQRFSPHCNSLRPFFLPIYRRLDRVNTHGRFYWR